MSNIVDQLLKLDANEIEMPKGTHKMYCKKLGQELEFEIEAIDAEKVAEIQEMCKNNIVAAKKKMAFEVTKLVHGEEEALKVLKTSEELFGKKNINDENMPSITVNLKEDVISVLDFISMTSIVSSKSEARRLIEQNGIEINGEKVKLNDLIEVKENKEIVIKKGKKTFLKVVLDKQN